MRLLVISGFLGSGKTTLLLEIARKLTSASEKVVVIENEIGEIGIDDQYLRQHGLQVQELYGGCICCTLSANLVLTLQKVEKAFEPDRILIEPTGLARPGDIKQTLQKDLPRPADIVNIALIDATRYDMLQAMLLPMLTAQIEAADILVITKTDLVEEEVVEDIICSVRELTAETPLFPISPHTGDNLEHLLESINVLQA